MSDPEGSSWFSGSGDLQWLCMVTLFAASLVTLLLYLVQYVQQGGPAERGHPGPTPTLTPARGQGQGQEVEALLDWVLSLGSWRSQWRGVWCRALNTEARRSGGQVLLSFDEEGLQASELVVRQVSNFHKEAGHKATRCTVVGEKLQFCLSAAAPPAGESQRYTVKMAPLQMQLDLDFQEAAEQVKVSWSVCRLEARELELSLSSSQDNGRASSASEVREEIKRLLCSTRPSVSLSCRSAQAAGAKSCSRVLSPPKPPRAHDWKLLVKNFRVTLGQQGGATGGVDVNPVCALLLDDPPQRFSTSVQKNTATPTWDQPFIFELNGRSKELNIQLLNDGEPPERSSLGQVSVPFDLVKKYPRGQQTFALTTKDGTVTGSLTTEFTYLEPSEVRSWQPPTPAPTKRVEMDRTVMPCGTVVTTITAVKSKPGRLLPLPALPATTSEPPQKWSPGRLERHVSEQPSPLGGTVSKALSSSDTELLMLNGADPVAEAAIRQLHQSAKQKLKSPVKKSTIIISGIAKTPVCQDDELALMADYAAAMDASMSECSSTQDVTAAAVATGTSSSSVSPAPNDDIPGMRQTPGGGTGCPPVAWDEQAGDNEVENVSLSMCVSEASCKKRRGSFLQKSAKLFFRRRHQRKDPGMSQSHNDLEHLEHPAVLERASRTATLSRMLNRKLLPRQRSKANGATSVGEPRQ